jgi:mono/diheme cytochrome c family protein
VNLTDVVSHAGFAGYAQVGFVVSLVTFVGLVAWVTFRPRSEMKAHAQMILDEEQATQVSTQVATQVSPQLSTNDRRQP